MFKINPYFGKKNKNLFWTFKKYNGFNNSYIFVKNRSINFSTVKRLLKYYNKILEVLCWALRKKLQKLLFIYLLWNWKLKDILKPEYILFLL